MHGIAVTLLTEDKERVSVLQSDGLGLGRIGPRRMLSVPDGLTVVEEPRHATFDEGQ